MSTRGHRAGPALPGGPGPSAPRHASVRLRAPLAAGGAGLAAVVLLAVTDPYRPGGHLVCPVLALTGWYCAGCGAQRAVHSLARGDVAAAWDMNALLVAAAPLVVVAWFRWLVPRPAPRRRGATAWVLLGVLVAFTVLRNVPVLAPVLAP